MDIAKSKFIESFVTHVVSPTIEGYNQSIQLSPLKESHVSLISSKITGIYQFFYLKPVAEN